MNNTIPYGQPLEAPAFYALEITTCCNSACIGCGNVFLHSCGRPPLNAGQWLAVLDSISPWAKRIKLTGGEPTLHPGFEQIVEGIQSHQISFSLFTNGLWSHPQRLIEFLANTSTCAGLLISLHGASPSVHAGFAGTESTFNRIVNNIEVAVSSGLPVSISTVVTKSNYDQLEEVVILGERLGVDHVAFNRYIGSHPDVEPNVQQIRVAIRSIEDMLRRNKRVGYGVCIPPCFMPNQSHGCSAGIAYGAIDPWGRVRPCTHALFATRQNLLETSIWSLWQSDVLQRWRQMLTFGCEGCKALSICHGGCTALKQIRSLKQDPLMTTRLSEGSWSRPHLTLPAKARPIPSYEAIECGEIINLVSDNGTVSLSAATRPLLDAIEHFSLEELEDNLGPEVVDFVGYLYTRGIVDFGR
jgi:radical SAM protein with 4Fe4S-binding SPASM domain